MTLPTIPDHAKAQVLRFVRLFLVAVIGLGGLDMLNGSVRPSWAAIRAVLIAAVEVVIRQVWQVVPADPKP